MRLRRAVDFLARKFGGLSKIQKRGKLFGGYPAVTDETAKNLKHFIVLAKRNTVPFGDEFRQEVILRKLDDYPMHIVKIENIYLTHGAIDWVLTFYAPDLVSAKRFVEETFARFSKYLQEYTLVETLVPVRKQGLKNPRIKDLVQFMQNRLNGNHYSYCLLHGLKPC